MSFRRRVGLDRNGRSAAEQGLPDETTASLLKGRDVRMEFTFCNLLRFNLSPEDSNAAAIGILDSFNIDGMCFKKVKCQIPIHRVGRIRSKG